MDCKDSYSGIKVSFIIPSYNQGRFIGECLDSILAKNLPDGTFEVIVVDGGSADGSVDIISKHSCVSDWISESDLGHFDGINKGIARSRGEWIAWINSDDYYLPGGVSKLMDFVENNPGGDIYYGEADEVSDGGGFIRDFVVEEWDYERLIDRCILCQPATIIRRSVFDEFGGLSSECKVAIDLEYWLRVGKHVKFVHAPIKVAASRLWGGTKSSNEQLAMQEDALIYGFKHGGRWS